MNKFSEYLQIAASITISVLALAWWLFWAYVTIRLALWLLSFI